MVYFTTTVLWYSFTSVTGDSFMPALCSSSFMQLYDSFTPASWKLYVNFLWQIGIFMTALTSISWQFQVSDTTDSSQFHASLVADSRQLHLRFRTASFELHDSFSWTPSCRQYGQDKKNQDQSDEDRPLRSEEQQVIKNCCKPINVTFRTLIFKGALTELTKKRGFAAWPGKQPTAYREFIVCRAVGPFPTLLLQTCVQIY